MKFVVLVGITLSLFTATASAQLDPLVDLGVESSAPEMAAADSDVTIAWTVTNLGPDTAADVTFLDPLPSGMTFVSLDSPAGWACTTPAVGSGGNIECTIATLAAAANAVFTRVAHIDAGTAAGTFLTSIGTATTATFDVNTENDASTANVQTPPLPPADLLVLIDAPSASNPDTDITYVTAVLNGGANAATNVTLTQVVPDTLDFVSIVQTSGPAFTCDELEGVITCTIASLAADAAASFTIVAHVPSGTSDGTQFQALVSITSDADPNVENDQVQSLLCIQADNCMAGPCVGATDVVCVAMDTCHEPGTCNSLTGACSPNTAKADAAPCNDGNACTQIDTCQSAVCVGQNPIVCALPTQCQTQGTCEPSTGTCVNPPKADTTPCDDGNACTSGDQCTAGACASGAALVCNDGDACTTDTCSATLGCVFLGECDDAGSDDDAGASPDAGTPDASVIADASTPDAAVATDAGDTDAAVVADAGGAAGNVGGGAGNVGGGAGSGGFAGTGVPAIDGGSADASLGDGGDSGDDDDGCSCRVGVGSSSRTSRTSQNPLWLSALAVVVIARRVHRRRAKHA